VPMYVRTTDCPGAWGAPPLGRHDMGGEEQERAWHDGRRLSSCMKQRNTLGSDWSALDAIRLAEGIAA
jgi:hypothetical protein